MAISVDGSGTQNVGFSTTTFSFSHTIGSGSDRLLLINPLAFTNLPNAISAITVDGNAATFIESVGYLDGGTTVRHGLYYYLAPSIGSVTVAGSFTTAGTIVVTVQSYFGVKQTSPVNAYTSGQTASASSFTIGITPSVADCWAFASIENHNSDISVSSGGTFRAVPPGGAGIFDSNAAITNGVLHDIVVTPASGSPPWSGIICALEAAASAAGQPTMRRWGGVPYVGGQGIGNKGSGRMWGRTRDGLIVPRRLAA